MVAATTGIALVVRATLELPDTEMLFLLTVMLAATLFGRGPSLLTAALSVGIYDFFFVPPYHTFAVEDFRYILTFAMMFGIGIVLSTLTSRLRRQQLAAVRAAVRAETEELRSSLLSSVSHDLRTPLAVITGAATTLRDDDGLSSETRTELLDTVCDEAERLERLLANILDMTRLDAGGVTLKRDWIPMLEVISGALLRVEKSLPQDRVTVTIPDGLPLVSVDPVLMDQLFVNLLENATKYTPADSRVEIRAEHVGDHVEVYVSDRGPGIPPEDLERVFERFTRGHHAGIGGVGLGLPIARAIAVAHGGRLTALVRAGGGTRFRLVIPVEGTPPERPSSESA
jgi:two-component system, OmpR family, sensor histidine kinase KdpD